MSVNTAFTNPEPTTDDIWAAYYQKVAGRPPRPLCMKAMTYYAAPNADLIGRAAVDLGCGDGTETMALLHHGWQVFALDQHSDAIARVEARVPEDQRHRLTTRLIQVAVALAAVTVIPRKVAATSYRSNRKPHPEAGCGFFDPACGCCNAIPYG